MTSSQTWESSLLVFGHMYMHMRSLSSSHRIN